LLTECGVTELIALQDGSSITSNATRLTSVGRVGAFMNLTTDFGVCFEGVITSQPTEGNIMLKTILSAASAIALASPAMAADLPVPPPYSQAPSYHSYEYRAAPPVVVEEPAPPVVIERPVVIARPPVVIEEYPVYAVPRAYAYAGPIWGHGWGWGHRHHFHAGW
jgi:hypothetical protein